MRWSILPRDKEGFKPLVYLLGLPVGFLLFAYSRIVREFVKEDYEKPPEGERRLAIGFHREFPLYLCTRKIWKITKVSKPSGWIGQNSWTGYLTALEIFTTSWVDCMLSTDPKSQPYKKVLKFLNEFPNDVYMRTDSGGPYNQVRRTAIRLAIDSKRDLVCFRQRTDKFFLVVKHFFAVPGATVKTRWTREFKWKELEKLGIEDATKMVNQEMRAILEV